MTTVRITIDDSLPLYKLKEALSVIRGITQIEVAESSEKEEYEQLKNAFLNGSKHSMSQQISKYIS